MIAAKFDDGAVLPLYDADYSDAVNKKLADNIQQEARRRVEIGLSDVVEIGFVQESNKVVMHEIVVGITALDNQRSCA